MKLLEFIKPSESKYAIMIVEINNRERRVIASLITDVCEYRDKRVNLQNLLTQLNAIMPLYPSEIKLPSEGCHTYLLADPDFWNFIILTL
jgi:hypothetical protein